MITNTSLRTKDPSSIREHGLKHQDMFRDVLPLYISDMGKCRPPPQSGALMVGDLIANLASLKEVVSALLYDGRIV